MKIGKVIAIVAGIISIMVGGIAIYQFANPKPLPSTSSPPPVRKQSFLEKVAGKYSLSSWSPANRPVALGIFIPEGSLEIQDDGTMDWSVLLEQAHAPNPGQVRMTARGRIQLSTKRVLGVKGGKYNNTHYLDSRWGQVSSDVCLAIRGWKIGQPEDALSLSIDEGSSRGILLEMANLRGTFIWTKR